MTRGGWKTLDEWEAELKPRWNPNNPWFPLQSNYPRELRDIGSSDWAPLIPVKKKKRPRLRKAA